MGPGPARSAAGGTACAGLMEAWPALEARLLQAPLAAEIGVEDIHLIAALGLHRRMTADEIRHIVGDRIFSTFWPDRLYQHDGEDPEANVYIGKTSAGEDVTLHKRAAETSSST